MLKEKDVEYTEQILCFPYNIKIYDLFICFLCVCQRNMLTEQSFHQTIADINQITNVTFFLVTFILNDFHS